MLDLFMAPSSQELGPPPNPGRFMHGYATGADETQIKIEHDFYYIKNFSFSLDVLIVFLTLKTMATGFGAR